MPTPGSHRYDVQHARERRDVERDWHPDEQAEREADRRMAVREPGPSPAAVTDRARGPYGEPRDGPRGDPGAVVDLRSPAFSAYTMIPARHTRGGGNIPPSLEWDAPPPESAECALVCED